MKPSKMSDINLWGEIFKRLPVKTLGQCRCVCKSWDSLIISPPFVTSHLIHYTQDPANGLLMYKHYCEPPEKEEQYTLFLDSAEGKEGNDLKVCHIFACPFMAGKSGRHFRVVGSVNGLICLSDDLFGHTYVVLLWNPLIRKYIKLPVPGATYQITVGSFISMLGFGYDSKKGDYKVVRLVYVRGKDALDITPPKVELYSVQEGKWRWVSADNVVDICVCDITWSQCFLKGNIHWIAWERDAKTLVFQRNWLLLFDVEQEKFKKMKVPETLSKVNTLNLSVSEYEGRLSVLYSELKGGFTGKEMDKCEIWVKNEYSVGSSWCQMVKVELDSCTGLGWIQRMRKSGEVLGFTKRGKLVSYDPRTKEAKKHGLCGRWRTWFTCAFTESLALLDKKNGVGTYKVAGKHRNTKKRFNYNVTRHNLAQTLVEEEVKVHRGGQEDTDDFYTQCRGFIFGEQMIKFGGGDFEGDFSDVLSKIGFR